MITKIASYRVKPVALTLVLEAVGTFVAAIQKLEPATRCDAFQYQSEPTRFVHMMTFPDEEAEKAHQQAAYTQSFVEVLYPNCENPPHFEQVSIVSQLP